MPLIQNTYGKGRVRVMRVHRGDRNEVRELTIQAMLDANGQPTAEVVATRDGATVISGVTGYTFI